jgi:uncharacterized membrane protein YidH (DUF202 family)
LSAAKIIALVLIAGGVLALVYGGFSYTKSTETTKLGPIEFTVKDRERVNVPVWVGVAAIGAGTVLLLLPTRRR